jgi:hypothetical protein
MASLKVIESIGVQKCMIHRSHKHLIIGLPLADLNPRLKRPSVYLTMTVDCC